MFNIFFVFKFELLKSYTGQHHTRMEYLQDTATWYIKLLRCFFYVDKLDKTMELDVVVFARDSIIEQLLQEI